MKFLFLGLLLTAPYSFAANTTTQEFESSGLTQVQVENLSGHISVSPSATNKTTVTATQIKFSDKCRMRIEKNTNKLFVKVEKTGLFHTGNDCEVNFDIKTAKTINIDVLSGSGDLNVTGLQGDLEFKIGSGNVAADGEFHHLVAKSGSGNIAVNGLTGGGDLKVGSGDISLKFKNQKPEGLLDIKTGSGNAVIAFPKGAQIKANLVAASGNLSNDLGSNPKADFSVSMKSGSGNLKIQSY